MMMAIALEAEMGMSQRQVRGGEEVGNGRGLVHGGGIQDSSWISMIDHLTLRSYVSYYLFPIRVDPLLRRSDQISQ